MPTLCINIQRLLTAQIKKIHNSQRKELWIFSLYTHRSFSNLMTGWG